MTLEDEQSDTQAEWEAACTERLGAGESCGGYVAVSARAHACRPQEQRRTVAPVPATFLSCYQSSHYSLLKLKLIDLSLYELTVSFPGWAPFNIWKKL